MTRACVSTRPASPKSATTSTGSQSLKMSREGGVVKKSFTTVAQTSFKAIAKSYSKEECFAQLKNLLPKSSQTESTSELALVEETIAYIAYLEKILQQNPTEKDSEVSSAVMLFRNMKFS